MAGLKATLSTEVSEDIINAQHGLGTDDSDKSQQSEYAVQSDINLAKAAAREAILAAREAKANAKEAKAAAKEAKTAAREAKAAAKKAKLAVKKSEEALKPE